MEDFRRSLSLDNAQGQKLRKLLCGVQIVLSSRWLIVMWWLHAILPLPFMYGLALLPAFALAAALLPAARGTQCRATLAVVCALLDAIVSAATSYGLFKLGMVLTEEPDTTLNQYWAPLLHLSIFMCFSTVVSCLAYVTLGVQGHCCPAASGRSCAAVSIELSAPLTDGDSGELSEHEDRPPPKDRGCRGCVAALRRLSDEEKVVCAVLLLWAAVLVTYILLCIIGLARWASSSPKLHDGPTCGDPLVGRYAPCALPFPSSFLLEKDPPSATGYRVAMTPETMPLSRWDGQLSPAAWNAQDGFSTISPILFAFAAAPIDPATLVGHGDIARSMDVTHSSTILLDVETGELVPHWIDLDAYQMDFGDSEAGRPPLLILQPARPLRHNGTYVVAVRNLKLVGGKAVDAEPAFAAVRDCMPPSCNPTSQLAGAQPPITWPAERTAEYNSIVFPALAKAGFIPRADQRSYLQLAWWFRTVSKESSLGVAKYIREKSMQAVPLAGFGEPTVVPVVDSVKDFECGQAGGSHGDDSWGGAHGVHIARAVYGHFDAPTFLRRAGPGTQTFYNFPGTDKEMDSREDPAGHSTEGPWWSRRNAGLGQGSGRSSGAGRRPMPTQLEETERVGWMARIPCSVMQGRLGSNATHQWPFILQYGHGLFGGRDEVDAGYLSKIANENGWILIAADWAGMAQYDVPMALRIMAARFDEFASMPQRTVQGYAYDAMLMRLMGTKAMSELPAFKTASGKKLLSPEHFSQGAQASADALSSGNIYLAGPLTAAYYGNSQGSVVGCGYCAYQRDIRRCVCGVPGSPFALLLSRSSDFDTYDAALKLQLTHAQDIRLAITLMQVLWDQGESGGWMEEMAPKQVLLQAGIGDAQVTNLAAEIMARAYGASTVEPQTRAVYGVPQRSAPFQGSALVEWLYDDVPDSPSANIGRTDGKDVHECPRREPAAQEQLRQFVEFGVVTQQCFSPLPSPFQGRWQQERCESKTCPSDYGPWPGSPLVG